MFWGGVGRKGQGRASLGLSLLLLLLPPPPPHLPGDGIKWLSSRNGDSRERNTSSHGRLFSEVVTNDERQ